MGMKAKYKAHEFGSCPRTLCEKQTVLPTGLRDTASLSGENPMKLYCAKCQELYDYNVPGGNYIDGAFFGTTFPHLFFQTYRELRPPPSACKYVPRVFGFKVHKVCAQTMLVFAAAPSRLRVTALLPCVCACRRTRSRYRCRSARSGPSGRRTSQFPIGTP